MSATLAGWVLLPLALVAVCLFLAWRRRAKIRTHRFGGLLWCADRRHYWGPCCEACGTGYVFRPAFRSLDGNQYMELSCPRCGRVLRGWALTLEALFEEEKRVALALGRTRAGLR